MRYGATEGLQEDVHLMELRVGSMRHMLSERGGAPSLVAPSQLWLSRMRVLDWFSYFSPSPYAHVSPSRSMQPFMWACSGMVCRYKCRADPAGKVQGAAGEGVAHARRPDLALCRLAQLVPPEVKDTPEAPRQAKLKLREMGPLSRCLGLHRTSLGPPACFLPLDPHSDMAELAMHACCVEGQASFADGSRPHCIGGRLCMNKSILKG